MDEVSAAQLAAERAWKPRANQWAIAITVMLATFMEVLDSSIANVALPHGHHCGVCGVLRVHDPAGPVAGPDPAAGRGCAGGTLNPVSDCFQ